MEGEKCRDEGIRCGLSARQVGGVQAGLEKVRKWVGQRKEEGEVLRNGWYVKR